MLKTIVVITVTKRAVQTSPAALVSLLVTTTGAYLRIGNVIRKTIVVIARMKVNFVQQRPARTFSLHVHDLVTVFRSHGYVMVTTTALINKTKWTVPRLLVSAHSSPVPIKKCAFLNLTNVMVYLIVMMALTR